MSWGNQRERGTMTRRPTYRRLGAANTFALAILPPITDASYWQVKNSTVTPAVITAPDGVSKAPLWCPAAGAAYGPGTTISHYVSEGLGGKKMLPIMVKGVGNTVGRRFCRQTGNGTGSYIDLTTGAITNSGPAVGSSTSLGNGWWTFSVDVGVQAPGPAYDYMYIADGGPGDGASGVYIWTGPLVSSDQLSANDQVDGSTGLTDTQKLGLGIGGLWLLSKLLR